MRYAADFETTTDENDCRVWASGICSIDDNLTFHYGNSIDWFFDFMYNHPNNSFYFHNLKFDGEFIICYLFEHGFKWINSKKLTDKTFTTLISDTGQFYSIEICFEAYDDYKRSVKIYDSLKLLPFSVDAVAKAFNLPIQKLELNYNGERSINHRLNDTEISYLKNDVEIMARALTILFNQNLNKMTTGSNALADYKSIIGKKNFNRWFPPPVYDADIRQSYKGGFTYCNPRFQMKEIGKGIVLDVNSLYPSVMYYNNLPYGEGIFFNGQYEHDEIYNVYVQMFTCNFELKEGYIPTLQLKNNLSFVPTEYVTSSKGEDITLCLTSVDLKLFLEHYNVYNIEYLNGWKFKSTTGLFKDYIDKWYDIKAQATIENNKPMRTLAKLMLNSLYGKFATNPNVRSKQPIYESGVIKYKNLPPEQREPIYIPIGAFITAWARNKTIRAAQKVYDRFLYADTDSLHLIGTDLPKELDIDDTKLGAWSHESTFSRAKFIRAKTYIEEIDNKLHITCAGMPSRCYDNVTWDNFNPGSSFMGKLQPTHVKGGIVLKDIDFTIKK